MTMSTAVMRSKSKLDVEFQYGGRLGAFNGMSFQSYVSHCRVLPLGEFTVTIPEPQDISVWVVGPRRLVTLAIKRAA